MVAGLEQIRLRIEEALEKAAEFNCTSTLADFENGAEGHDCTLCNDAGSLFVD